MRSAAIMLGAGLAGLVACVQVVTMPDAQEGAALFAANCAQCHGTGGKGDGPWAVGMRPPPADLTRLAAGDKFPRARVLSIIDGYDRTGLPGQEMPEFGLLLEGPTVPLDVGDGVLTPTPRPLAALLAFLESIQKK